MWGHCDRPYAYAQCHNRITDCTPDDYAACYGNHGPGYYARAQRGDGDAHACDL